MISPSVVTSAFIRGWSSTSFMLFPGSLPGSDASVWFISMAVYYLVLGGLRAYLVICYRHRNANTEYCGYRRTAWLLFLLNIPMGVMILLMMQTNSGFSYPGYVIYLSALLHHDNCCHQSCKIPQAGQPDPLCRQGIKPCIGNDVGSRPSDSNDLPLF